MELKKTNHNLKALILAGGRGKRLEAVNNTKNKCMLLYKDKPLIEYNIIHAINADVSEIIIVVGYKAEDIIDYFGNNYKGTQLRYIIQEKQKGLVHAIECSKDKIGKSDFILFLGDEFLIDPDHNKMIETFYSQNITALCGIIRAKEVKDISKTYTVIQDNSSSIFRLIEKPNNPIPGNNIMGTGNCIFKNHIFDYIDETPINQKRGEKELVDLIQSAIDNGHTVKSFELDSIYMNINDESDLNILNKQ